MSFRDRAVDLCLCALVAVALVIGLPNLITTIVDTRTHQLNQRLVHLEANRAHIEVIVRAQCALLTQTSAVTTPTIKTACEKNP